VTLPSGLQSVGDEAFKACYNLTVTLHNSFMTSYGKNAFEKSVTFKSRVFSKK